MFQIRRFRAKIALVSTTILFVGCTPTPPDYCCDRQNNAAYDMCRLSENACYTSRPLLLGDILQIALARNLDMQLQCQELAMQCQTYMEQKLAQLPSLTVDGEFSDRNNQSAWLSKNYRTGVIDYTGTVSSTPTVKRINVEAAFNLIDFGLTYVKTRQEINRAAQMQQRHLRARQNLVLDVFRAYYRAVVARQAKLQAERLIGALDKRQTELQRQMEEQTVSEMKGLLNENRLVDMQVRLYAFDNEYRSAVTELSALMGMPPGTCYELAEVNIDTICHNPLDPNCLVNVALLYRPELMAQDIQYHIDADEVRASMIRMFPNANLFGGFYHDDDQLTINHNWWKAGVGVTWDLLRLPSKRSRVCSDKFKRDQARETRLSMSMGILTQVHLAYIGVEENQKQYKLAEELKRIKSRQLEVSKLMELRGQLDIDDVLGFEVEALFAQVNALKSYSNLKVAYEQLGNSIGRPLFFSDIMNKECFDGIVYCCDFDDGEALQELAMQQLYICHKCSEPEVVQEAQENPLHSEEKFKELMPEEPSSGVREEEQENWYEVPFERSKPIPVPAEAGEGGSDSQSMDDTHEGEGVLDSESQTEEEEGGWEIIR